MAFGTHVMHDSPGPKGGSCSVLYSTFLHHLGTLVPQQLNEVIAGQQLTRPIDDLGMYRIANYGWWPRLAGVGSTERIT